MKYLLTLLLVIAVFACNKMPKDGPDNNIAPSPSPLARSLVPGKIYCAFVTCKDTRLKDCERVKIGWFSPEEIGGMKFDPVADNKVVWDSCGTEEEVRGDVKRMGFEK